MQYSVNNIQLNVLESGSGPLTLLLLHYFGGSAREWQLVVAKLANRYRCVAVDLRGHGDSMAPETGYAVTDMADDIQGIIQVMAIEDFVLIGHSMGGKVALELTSRHPAGLRSLLLVSPSPPEPEPISETDRNDMLDTHGQQTAAEEMLAKITAKPLSEPVKGQIIADNLRTSKAAWDAWLTLGSKEDISEQMRLINVPVHIIVGVQDKAIPPDVQQTMTVPHLPGATLDRIEGAGHLLPWETPDELTAFVREKISAVVPKHPAQKNHDQPTSH